MTSRHDPPGSESPKKRGWTIIAGEPRAAAKMDDTASLEGTDSIGRAPRFRDKAAEVRRAAEQMVDPDSRRTLMQVADHYERLADRADRQSADMRAASPRQRPDADD